jgi:two-component system OmpR family response regulator/two-component system response regulator QseB
MRVLLVEDDAQLGKAVRMGLEQQGHAVDWVRDGVEAEAAALTGGYAAVLLDLGLPRQDGMKVLENLRRKGFAEPVLIVTARDQIPERVMGLDAGATDFIIKPFDLRELGARLRAATRRYAGQSQPEIVYGDLKVDPATRTVLLRGEPVSLTAREYTLLLHMLMHRGRLQTRHQLQEALYSWGQEIESNAVEVHIHHLRRKCGKNLIQTLHGHGYLTPSDPGSSED